MSKTRFEKVALLQTPNARQPRRAGGFTLLEMLGVLAVIAVLVAAVTQSVIRRIDQAAWTKETADLSAIADSFTQRVLRTKTIPAYTGIAAAVANELALPVNAINTTPRGYDRAFLVDPDLRINGAVLPYMQTANTNLVRPASARMMIVSSLRRALPVASGIPLASEFNAIWNAAENAKPSTWTTWAGSGEDLRIKRINLEPLFHRLVLANRDGTGAARFSIDSTTSTNVPSGPVGCDAYLLDGTVVGLHDSAGVPMTKYLLNRDISFVFERDKWNGWIGPGNPYFTTSDDFVQEAEEFLGSGWNQNAARGASQTGVLVAMYVFMFDYALWAEECPPFDRHGADGGNNPQQVPEYAILDSLGKNQAGGILFEASQNLLNR